MGLIARFVRAAEARPFRGTQIFLAAGWVAAVRFLEEKAFIYDAQRQIPRNDLGIVLAWFAFYAALLVFIAAIISHLGRVHWKNALQAASFGLTLAILPPLIDIWIYGRGNFFYRYQTAFFVDMNFLLFDATKGIPFGEAFTVWLSILLTGLYVYHKTRSTWRSVAAGFAQYCLGIFMGAVLPVFAEAFFTLPGAQQLGDKWIMAWIGVALCMIAYGLLRPQIWRDALPRLGQIALGPALVVLGSAYLGRLDLRTALAAVTFGGMTTVFALTNLYYDRKEDEAQGRRSRVDVEDVAFLHGWTLLLLATLVRHHLYLALCLALFQLVAYAYHADPARTKCIFPLSYKSEGFFAASAFLAGIVCHPVLLDTHHLAVTALIFGGFSLSAPFKDAKDVEGDRAGRVATLYVVLERRGWTFTQIHRLVAVLLGSCLVVPVVWLAQGPTPLPWVIALGTCGFVTTAVTRLRRLKLGVALAVWGVTAYVVTLAAAVMTHPPGGPG